MKQTQGLWKGKTKDGKVVIGRFVNGEDFGCYGSHYIMSIKENGKLGAPQKGKEKCNIVYMI